MLLTHVVLVLESTKEKSGHIAERFGGRSRVNKKKKKKKKKVMRWLDAVAIKERN